MLLTIKAFIESLNQLWLYFKLQTQILLLLILLTLLFINKLTYESILTLKHLPNFYNIQELPDISALRSANLKILLEENRTEELSSIFERFYLRSTSIRSLIYINEKGNIYGIPYEHKEIVSQPNFTTYVKHRISEPHNPSYWLDSNNIIFTILEVETATFFGIVIIENDANVNITLFNNLLLTNHIIFFIVILFITLLVLNLILINVEFIKPVNEISLGLTNISAGNFTKRLNLRSGSELGELISNFNEVGQRLQFYEKENKKQLRTEKLKLESIIGVITDGIIFLDTNLTIVLINKAAIEIFGWNTKPRLLGTSIWPHLPIMLQKKLFVTLQNTLRGSKNTTFETNLENGLNSSPNRLICINLTMVYDFTTVNKKLIGIRLTIQDQTKEFELAETQNRFISNISHELRTPLFNIKSFIETIQEYNSTLSYWQKEYFLNIVNKETNRLTRLVNDILCISRLNSRQEVQLTLLNINKIIYQTIANYQILARDKNLYLHFKNDCESIHIYGNNDLLTQAFTNLISNALKFTYPWGEIFVRTYCLNKTKIRVEIIDTGIGVLPRYQTYIFQRFYRIENQVHTLKGTGLGLSIVNTILLEHKTKIKLISRDKVGSIFWFDLKRS